MKRLLSILVLTVFTAGCARFSLVEPKRVELDGGAAVSTPIAWNKFTGPGSQGERWTIDGPQLQELFLISGLEDNGVLFGANPGQDEDDLPRYKTNSTPIEIREFIESSITKSGFQNYKETSLGAAALGGRPAIRVEFIGFIESGLEYKGVYVATEKDGKLYGVVYRGTRLVYFDRGLEAVEAIIKSFTFTGQA